jgi:hypothetical protein
LRPSPPRCHHGERVALERRPFIPLDFQQQPQEPSHEEEAVDTVEFSDSFEFLDALRLLPLCEARWVFRGQPDASWQLAPLIERIPVKDFGYDIWVAERDTLLSFKRRAHQYLQHLPENNDVLEWLALMRHYGAPTRLLDWTKSPYVATFFALAEAKPDRPSAIWAVDAERLKIRAIEILCAQPEFSNLGFAAHLGSPENFGRVFLEGQLPPAAIVAPVEPIRMNERLTLQQGLFLCSNRLYDGFYPALKETLGDILGQEYETPQPPLRKLVIKPEARSNLLRELERTNISYATLFPGLDGFARSLSTHMQMRGSVDSFVSLGEGHLY